MHCAIFCLYSAWCETASQMITRQCAITRLFLRNGCDIHEIYKRTLIQHPFLGFLDFLDSQTEGIVKSPEWSEEPVWQNKSHYMRTWLDFLRDQDIDIDYSDYADFYGWTLLQVVILHQHKDSGSYQRSTEGIFILCAMGTNVAARMPEGGVQPLHLVGSTPYSPERAFHIRVQFEILLNFGADPCARDARGRTVTEMAFSGGWKEQWVQALCKCNKVQVVIEQLVAERSGQTDAPLDNAMRTGVDVTDLSTPSVEGLSRRIAARGDRLDD